MVNVLGRTLTARAALSADVFAHPTKLANESIAIRDRGTVLKRSGTKLLKQPKKNLGSESGVERGRLAHRDAQLTPPLLLFRLQGSGARIWGLRRLVHTAPPAFWGVGSRVYGLGLRVQGSRYRLQDCECSVWSSGFSQVFYQVENRAKPSNLNPEP